MKKFSKAFLECIKETQITSVRAGKDRTKFTGIWMVETGGRIFARSYNLSERSWYISFLNGNEGDIKCGKDIIPVRGLAPADINTLTEAINKAYEKKYLVKAYNKKWVDGLIQPERVAKNDGIYSSMILRLQNSRHTIVGKSNIVSDGIAGLHFKRNGINPTGKV